MFSLDFPPFVPHPLLRSGHLQTIVGNAFGSPSPTSGTRHRVQTGDGDQLVLHEGELNRSSAGRIAFLVHGLGGSHASGYLQRLSAKLAARGIQTVLMDQRGCGAGEPLARHMAHAGRAPDIAHCLWWLATRHPESTITVCGFSLGASIVLKALANEPLPETVDSAIAVSPPFDLADCCARIPRLYDRYYARRLWEFWLKRGPHLAGGKALNIPRKPKTILEFDQWITAPLNGYASVESYYAAASAGLDLHKIDLPTLVLLDEDDPIVPLDDYDEARLGDKMTLVRTRGGGHLGYISRSSGPDEDDRRWMEWRIADWVTQASELCASGF